MTETILRHHGLLIVDHAVKELSPHQAMAKAMYLQGNLLNIGGQQWDLDRYENVYAIGAGKAGAAMATGLEDILGEYLSDGLVVVKEGHGLATRKIRVMEAAHPVPDERSLLAGRALIDFVRRKRSAKTLFVFLLSGGASSLVTAPAPGISLADKQEVTRLLLASGADIGEINLIRKHLSLFKGGGLAREISPADVASLVISDVIGDRLEVIGSGPMIRDESTWEQGLEILERYRLTERIPSAILRFFREGARKERTPNQLEDGCKTNRITHHIIARNLDALEAAAAKAKELGYRSLILSSSIEGETVHIAMMHGAMAREIIASGNPISPPCCLISGGETTVRLGEHYGKGGRNQEFALAAAHVIKDLNKVVILSAGSDGTDGPTDAAGAIVDSSTLTRATTLGLDANHALRYHDSYPFFETLGDLIITGPTMTNVMDIRIILIGV